MRRGLGVCAARMRPASRAIAHAGAVVHGPRAEVPRVEVRADQHDLAGPLAAGHLADHVGALGVGQGVGGERQVHAHRLPLGEDAVERLRVGDRERRGGDLVLVLGLGAGVRQAVVVRADRAQEHGHRAELRGLPGAVVAVAHGLAVAGTVARPAHLGIEEDDLPAHRVGAELPQLLDVRGLDDVGVDPACRRGNAASERRDGQRHRHGRDDGRVAVAALPVRDVHLLCAHVGEAEPVHRALRPGHGGAVPRGPGHARADLVAKRPDDGVRVRRREGVALDGNGRVGGQERRGQREEERAHGSRA